MADSPPPGFSGTFDQALDVVKITNYIGVAAVAIVVYDTLVSLPREAKFVWGERIGVPTIIYLLNRYGVVIQAAVNVVTILDVDLSMNECLSFNLFSTWTVPAVILLIEAMLVLRLTALYGHNRRVTLPMWTLWVCSAVTMCALTGVMLSGSFPIGTPASVVTGCELDGSLSLFWAVWVPSLVLEMVIVSLTLSRIISHRRNGIRTPLMTVLVRDGFVYFVVVFSLMLINMVLCLTPSAIYYTIMAEMTLCVSSSLCSRMFLNLRDVGYTQGLVRGHGSSTEDTYELSSTVKNPVPAHPDRPSTGSPAWASGEAWYAEE